MSRSTAHDIAHGNDAHDGASLYTNFAELVSLVGTSSFYDTIADLLARITHCRKRLVMRYATYDRPSFIINKAISEDVAETYLAGLYRIDPLYIMSRTNKSPMVVNLRAMSDEHLPDTQYLTELFRSAFIFDELAIMLPVYGGVTIAICCQREHQRFTEAEARFIETILPLLNAVHKLHIDQFFSTAGKHGTVEDDGLAGAMLILDSRSKRVYANLAWDACEQVQSRLPLILAHIQEDTASNVMIGEEYIVHWERLPKDFSLAPGGTLLMIDRRSPGPLGMSAKRAVERFCETYSMTPREMEIVSLLLIGLPNALIAEKLGVSVGTVKNHRWRLYYKLDITSERELFRLFLSTLLSIEIAGTPDEERPTEIVAAS